MGCLVGLEHSPYLADSWLGRGYGAPPHHCGVWGVAPPIPAPATGSSSGDTYPGPVTNAAPPVIAHEQACPDYAERPGHRSPVTTLVYSPAMIRRASSRPPSRTDERVTPAPRGRRAPRLSSGADVA